MWEYLHANDREPGLQQIPNNKQQWKEKKINKWFWKHKIREDSEEMFNISYKHRLKNLKRIPEWTLIFRGCHCKVNLAYLLLFTQHIGYSTLCKLLNTSNSFHLLGELQCLKTHAHTSRAMPALRYRPPPVALQQKRKHKPRVSLRRVRLDTVQINPLTVTHYFHATAVYSKYFNLPLSIKTSSLLHIITTIKQ